MVQDIAVLVLQTHHETPFQSPEHLLHWSLKTLRWRALDELRREKRYSQVLKSSSLEPDTEQGLRGEEGEKFALLSDVLKATKFLPPRQQQVMRLTLAGKSMGEIATELDIKESTVRSVLRFAKAGVLEYFDREPRVTDVPAKPGERIA